MPVNKLDSYFIEVLNVVATGSTCDRGKVGCIITRGNSILASGYADSPDSTGGCDELGHLMSKVVVNNISSNHCIRSVHAEQSAIGFAAKQGISINNSTLYCTLEPCYSCAKLIAVSGISRVVCKKPYQRAEETRELFKSINIPMIVIEGNHNER